MGFYRRVDCRMWGDTKFRRLSPLKPSGQALWIWLLTGPATHSMPGLLHIGPAGAAEMLRWPLDAFLDAMADVIREAMAYADFEARLIWVPNAIRYNPPTAPNIIKSWQGYWDSLPECELKAKAYQHLTAFVDTMGEGFRDAFAHAIAYTGTGTGTGTGLRLSSKTVVLDPSSSHDKSTISEDEIRSVYQHYLDTMGKTPQTYKLTAKRRTKIAARLREFTPEALRHAIDACSRSEFHMGRNKSSALYNDLADHVLRSYDRVERWLYGHKP